MKLPERNVHNLVKAKDSNIRKKKEEIQESGPLLINPKGRGENVFWINKTHLTRTKSFYAQQTSAGNCQKNLISQTLKKGAQQSQPTKRRPSNQRNAKKTLMTKKKKVKETAYMSFVQRHPQVEDKKKMSKPITHRDQKAQATSNSQTKGKERKSTETKNFKKKTLPVTSTRSNSRSIALNGKEKLR